MVDAVKSVLAPVSQDQVLSLIIVDLQLIALDFLVELLTVDFEFGLFGVFIFIDFGLKFLEFVVESLEFLLGLQNFGVVLRTLFPLSVQLSL